MFTLRKKAEDASSALPALMIKAERAAQNVLHGEHPQRKSGTGEKFWQFREYSSQDRPQDIDWRQSGKTDQVYIRQKERQLPQTALLWASSSLGMNFTSGKYDTKRDEAHVLLLALALLMTRHGERVGMLGEKHTGRSENTLSEIANLLTGDVSTSSLPATGPGRGQKNAALILAGDFLDTPDVIEAAFKNLAVQTPAGLIIHVLDPAEIDLPWNGRALFETPGQHDDELVQNIASIRAEYRTRIEKHIEAVRSIAHHCGWYYVLHRTDTPHAKTLMDIWMHLSALRETGAA